MQTRLFVLCREISIRRISEAFLEVSWILYELFLHFLKVVDGISILVLVVVVVFLWKLLPQAIVYNRKKRHPHRVK